MNNNFNIDNNMNISNNHNISINNPKNTQNHKNSKNNKNNKNINIIWADEVGQNLTQTQEDVSDIEADWKEFLNYNRTFLNEEEIKQLNAQFEYNEKQVQDALFGEAVVFGERINVIFDSGSKGCAVTKQFLDRKGQNIDLWEKN